MLALTFKVDEPVCAKLLLLRARTAASLKILVRGRVERKGEKVLRLHEVGDKTTAVDEVDKAENIGGKHEGEHNIEYTLPSLSITRGVVLCLERGVEALVLRATQGGDGGGVIPVMDEGGLHGAVVQSASSQHREGFGD